MQKVVKLVNEGPAPSRLDDDFADRLSSRYTVLFLVVFTVVVSSHLYIGSPITCYIPKEFGRGWIRYTNSYCWVRNTYYLPQDAEISGPHGDRDDAQEVRYYQWVPFVLLVQAIGFYLPSAVWHAFNQKSGVDCDSILATARKYHYTTKKDGRNRLLRLVTNQLHRFLRRSPDDSEQSPRSCMSMLCCCVCSVTHGRYLTMLYAVTKILYLANVTAQFFFLNLVLGNDYFLYGYNIIHDFIFVVKTVRSEENTFSYEDYSVNSRMFPRVTFCDFTIRRMGNLHPYTVQCMLPINMYSEKIFAFLWFWMLLVAIVSALSFLQWMTRFLCEEDKYRYIRAHLSHPAYELKRFSDPDRQKHAVADFVDIYLQQDGVFVLQLVGHNTNNVTVDDMLCCLWNEWVEAEKDKMKREMEIV